MSENSPNDDSWVENRYSDPEYRRRLSEELKTTQSGVIPGVDTREAEILAEETQRLQKILEELENPHRTEDNV